MTIIRQYGISDSASSKRLQALINEDDSVLLRSSYNLAHCTNIKRWATFMEATRRRYGHDKASRHVRSKKTGELVPAKNTIMFHQILAFLPDECDINGGKLTPEDCMRYAKEYVERYYSEYEVVLAVQKVTSEGDGVSHYVSHVIINRSNIADGKRLDEGRGDVAARKHVAHVKEMDERWGMKQVERKKQNSAIHPKQDRPHRKARH